MAANETTPAERIDPPAPRPAERPATVEAKGAEPIDERPPLREQRSAWPEWRRFPPMSRPRY